MARFDASRPTTFRPRLLALFSTGSGAKAEGNPSTRHLSSFAGKALPFSPNKADKSGAFNLPAGNRGSSLARLAMRPALRRSLVVALSIFCSACASPSYRMKRAGRRAGAPKDVEYKNLEDFARASESSSGPKVSVKVPKSNERLNLRPSEYILGRHDELNIYVMDHPEMSSQRVDLGQISGTTIKEDGSVHLPVLGTIPAAGKTLIEFEKLLRERVAGFVGRPEVSVEILKYRSKQFYVLGQVTTPGVFAVDGRTSLLQGISNAGGLLPTASLSSSFLVRNGKLMPVDLMSLVEGGDVRQNVYMRNGDLVFIASSQAAQIVVVGEVRQPGVVPIVSGRLTLGQALAQAGGPTMARARREISVLRGGYGRPTVYTMDLESALLVDDRLLLQPGDRVVVAPTGLSQASRYMEQILPFLNGIWAVGSGVNSVVDVVTRQEQLKLDRRRLKREEGIMNMQNQTNNNMMNGSTMNNPTRRSTGSRRLDPQRIQPSPRN